MHCVHSKTFQFKLFNQKILATVVEQLLLEQFCIRFHAKGLVNGNGTESTPCACNPTGYSHMLTSDLFQCRSVSVAETCKNGWEGRYSALLTLRIVPVGCTEEEV